MQVVLNRVSRLVLFAAMLAALVGASLPGASRAQDATPEAECVTTTPEQNKELITAFWEEVVWGPQGKVAEMVSPDEVHHWGIDMETTGFDAFAETYDLFLAPFPDIRYTVDLLAAEGDMVASRQTATATHSGEWQGIAPTNKEVVWQGINIFRIECGMIAEAWGKADHLGLLAQVGSPDVPAFLADVAVAKATPMVGTSSAAPCASDTPEANLELVQRWINEVFAGHNPAVLNEIAAPEIVHHSGASPDKHGVDAVMASVSRRLAVFPDMSLTIDEAIAEGDLVAARWSGTATNEGEFLPGLAPSGQETSISGINIYQVNCGQIVESWSELNGLSILRQIQDAGVVATPAA